MLVVIMLRRLGRVGQASGLGHRFLVELERRAAVFAVGEVEAVAASTGRGAVRPVGSA